MTRPTTVVAARMLLLCVSILLGLHGGISAQEVGESGSGLGNGPVSRQLLPQTATNVSDHDQVAFNEARLEKPSGTDQRELKWRRRDIATASYPGKVESQSRNSQARPRVARQHDPLDDPFGDRTFRVHPQGTLMPGAAPRLHSATGVAGFSARRQQVGGAYGEGEPVADGDSRVGCEALAGTPITSIKFSMAPQLFPGQSEEKRERYLNLLRKLIGNPVVTWTTYEGADRSVEKRYEGRFKSQSGDDYITIVTIETLDNQIIELGKPETGWLTAETVEMAHILTNNPKQSWTDKQGHVVAEGWFIDYINDSVVIRTAEGEDISIRHNDLSNGALATVSELWDLPIECGVPEAGSAQRHWVAQTYTWKASALCHKPLYFEDIQLERYGHSGGFLMQPVRSGAHFFLNIAALPYHVGVYPPRESRYALGYYRPGNCAPFRGYAFPVSPQGGLTAAGFYVGAPFVLP